MPKHKIQSVPLWLGAWQRSPKNQSVHIAIAVKPAWLSPPPSEVQGSVAWVKANLVYRMIKRLRKRQPLDDKVSKACNGMEFLKRSGPEVEWKS